MKTWQWILIAALVAVAAYSSYELYQAKKLA